MSDYSEKYPQVAVIDGHLVTDKFVITSHALRTRANNLRKQSDALVADFAQFRYLESPEYARKVLRKSVQVWWDGFWPKALFTAICLIPVTGAIAHAVYTLLAR